MSVYKLQTPTLKGCTAAGVGMHHGFRISLCFLAVRLFALLLMATVLEEHPQYFPWHPFLRAGLAQRASLRSQAFGTSHQGESRKAVIFTPSLAVFNHGYLLVHLPTREPYSSFKIKKINLAILTNKIGILFELIPCLQISGILIGHLYCPFWESPAHSFCSFLFRVWCLFFFFPDRHLRMLLPLPTACDAYSILLSLLEPDG